MKIRKTGNTRRRGMTTMEFALILPFLLMFVMGMIEMGNMFYSWMTVQKAAQSGARFAATGLGDEQGTRLALIEEETQKWLGALNSGAKTVTVTSWPTTDCTGAGNEGDPGTPCGIVEVAVDYDYRPFIPVISAILPEVVRLNGSDRKLNEPWKPCDEPT